MNSAVIRIELVILWIILSLSVIVERLVICIEAGFNRTGVFVFIAIGVVLVKLYTLLVHVVSLGQRKSHDFAIMRV